MSSNLVNQKDRYAEYNPLGQYILDNLRGRSLAHIARESGMSVSNLARWARRDLTEQMPKPEVLQRIADGLNAPLSTIQQIVLEAAGHQYVGEVRDAQEAEMLAALRSVKEPRWRQAVIDAAKRVIDELDQ